MLVFPYNPPRWLLYRRTFYQGVNFFKIKRVEICSAKMTQELAWGNRRHWKCHTDKERHSVVGLLLYRIVKNKKSSTNSCVLSVMPLRRISDGRWMGHSPGQPHSSIVCSMLRRRLEMFAPLKWEWFSAKLIKTILHQEKQLLILMPPYEPQAHWHPRWSAPNYGSLQVCTHATAKQTYVGDSHTQLMHFTKII